MDLIIDTAKRFLPGSLPFLMLGLAAGALLLYGRDRHARWARLWLSGLAALYLLLSLPVGPAGLVWGLSAGIPRIAMAEDAAGAGAVVVLSGGAATFRDGDGGLEAITEASAWRAIEAARVYHLLGDPLVITSGGIMSERQLGPSATVLARALVELGVPAERILAETASRSTRDHAVLIPPLLEARGIDRFVLVTSATHARRATWAFEAVGLDPIPSIARMDAPPAGRLARWLPSRGNLRVSELAFYDYLGLAYYWTRGWI